MPSRFRNCLPDCGIAVLIFQLPSRLDDPVSPLSLNERDDLLSSRFEEARLPLFALKIDDLISSLLEKGVCVEIGAAIPISQ